MKLRRIPLILVLTAAASISGAFACGTSTSSGPTFHEDDNCPRTIAQYCGTATCAPDFATAKLAAVTCNPNVITSYHAAEKCKGFDILITAGVDTGTTAYYSTTDGKLAAIVSYGASGGGGSSCVAANTATFTPPDCTTVKLSCADAGTPDGDGSVDAAHD